METCSDCRHWVRYAKDDEQEIPGTGRCTYAKHFNTAFNYGYASDDDYTPTLDPESKDQLVFVKDADGYAASLVTHWKFSCSLWQDAEGRGKGTGTSPKDGD